MCGEYLAISKFHKTMPALVFRPYEWERYKSDSKIYFFVCKFVNISHRLPDPVQLGSLIAELHRKSVLPTGKFGFPVPTYDGSQVQMTTRDESWPRLFVNLLKGIQELDWNTDGHWKELDDAPERTYTHVVPRLLGALKAEGIRIKPCLIHGDLWESNIGTDLETGNIIIYDASAYYAFNEMEIGIWRVDQNRMKEEAYRREYLRNLELNEPAKEWDGRNRLYSVETTLINSASFVGTDVRLRYGRLLKLLSPPFNRETALCESKKPRIATQDTRRPQLFNRQVRT